ncbi:MAG TPA: DUF6799 domain-containing protein [Anaerolineales bacterium]|nr:DUF6799 domain-containing protein [Anaerolineales bacterium]
MVIEDGMLMMKNGQMIILINGELITLIEDMILADGTRIALDGTVTTADGSYEVIGEGQAVMVDNRITL